MHAGDKLLLSDALDQAIAKFREQLKFNGAFSNDGLVVSAMDFKFDAEFTLFSRQNVEVKQTVIGAVGEEKTPEMSPLDKLQAHVEGHLTKKKNR